jgi:malate dehydrogenase (quinone)
VFKDKVATPEWQQKMRQIVPSYGTKLNDSPAKVVEEWTYTSDVLQLSPPPKIDLTTPSQATGAAPARPAKASADMAL